MVRRLDLARRLHRGLYPQECRHRQQCDFGAGQRDPLRARPQRRAAPRLDLYFAGRRCAATAASARRLQQCGGRRNIVFLSFEERMMSRDMSGRFGPIYRSLIVTPGAPDPAGLRFMTFTKKSGYMNEVLVAAKRPGKDAVRGALPERTERRGIAGAVRARHPYRRRPQPDLPVSRANCWRTGRRSTQPSCARPRDAEGSVARGLKRRAVSAQVDVEDSHREIVVAVVIVPEDDAEEFVAEIDSRNRPCAGAPSPACRDS